MLNEKHIKHGIIYAKSLKETYNEDEYEHHYLRGMIDAYEMVLEI